MKKRLFMKTMFVMVMTVLCMLTAITASAETTYTEGYYTYTLDNGNAVIKSVDRSIGGDITIPETLGGYPVTTINYSAFQYCDDITSVTIPNSVTTIRSSAFRYCDSLTKINVSSGVTFIDELSFSGESIMSINVDENNTVYSSDDKGILFNKDKTLLITYPRGSDKTFVSIPDSVTAIGEYAFSGSFNLESVTIPDSVTSIGDNAFSNVDKLTNVDIPDSVKTIGKNTFANCDNLKSIKLGAGVESIGDAALRYCPKLENVIVDENNLYYSSDEYGVLFNKKKTNLIIYPGSNAKTTYDIPNSVTYIGNYAFEYCNNLTSVTIPDSVASIDYCAFHNCGNITDFTIPDSVTYMDWYAFYVCKSLKKITVDENNLYFSNDESGALFNKDKTKLIQYPNGRDETTYLIPDSVKIIGTGAFGECFNLKNIIIPGDVTNIETGAFLDCNLEHVGYKNDITAWEGIKQGYGIGVRENDIHFDFNTETDIQVDNVAPTCLDDGSKTVVCSCGYIYSVEAEYALGHDMLGFVTEISSSCTDKGREINNCSRCDYYETRETEELGHDMLGFVTEISSTCTDKGREINNCSRCDYYIIRKTEKLGHDMLGFVTEISSTCTDKGREINNCSRCDYYETRETEALGHSMGDWAVNEKESVRVCLVCGYKEIKAVTEGGDVQVEIPGGSDDLDVDADCKIEGDNEYILAEEVLDKNGSEEYEILKVFDINLKNKDGVHVQPDGTVKVKLPLDWEKNGNYKVYRVNDDGTLTDMNAFRQGSHMVFETDHFSIYIIVEKTESSSETPEKDNKEDCSCNCHESGFMGFIWKIINFFNKLFKINKTCACGINHY